MRQKAAAADVGLAANFATGAAPKWLGRSAYQEFIQLLACFKLGSDPMRLLSSTRPSLRGILRVPILRENRRVCATRTVRTEAALRLEFAQSRVQPHFFGGDFLGQFGRYLLVEPPQLIDRH